MAQAKKIPGASYYVSWYGIKPGLVFRGTEVPAALNVCVEYLFSFDPGRRQYALGIYPTYTR